MKKDELCRSSSFFVFNHRYLPICSDISPAERFSVGFYFYSIKYIIYPNNP